MNKKYILSIGVLSVLSGPLLASSCFFAWNNNIEQDVNDIREVMQYWENFLVIDSYSRLLDTNMTNEEFSLIEETTSHAVLEQGTLDYLKVKKTFPSTNILKGVTTTYKIKIGINEIRVELQFSKNGYTFPAHPDHDIIVTQLQTRANSLKKHFIQIPESTKEFGIRHLQTLSSYYQNEEADENGNRRLTQDLFTTLGYDVLPQEEKGVEFWYSILPVEEEINFPFPTSPLMANYNFTIILKVKESGKYSYETSLVKIILANKTYQEYYADSFISEINNKGSSINNVYLPYGTTDNEINSELILDSYKYIKNWDFIDLHKRMGFQVDAVNINKANKTFKVEVKHPSYQYQIISEVLTYENRSQVDELYAEGERIAHIDLEPFAAGTNFEAGEKMTSGTTFEILSEKHLLAHPLFNYSITVLPNIYYEEQYKYQFATIYIELTLYGFTHKWDINIAIKIAL